MSRPFNWIDGVGKMPKKSYCPTCDILTESKRNGRLAMCEVCGCTKGVIDI